MKTDQDFLRAATDKGNEVATPFNFGAVVVRDGEIIGADHAHVWDQHDPSAHSEVSAMRAAGKKLGSWELAGCTLYASHEPCAMCFACAAWAGIDRIVFAIAATEQDAVMYEFKDPNIMELAKQLNRSMKIEQLRLKEK
jgi:tRNA(Arg) A34 adenosine deaminase TadA